MQAQGMWSAGDGDDNRRFLADLRALRDAAALPSDELAARAHYPTDVLKEAESGPSLPTLPILAAYVRACDADVLEWEERWRRLGFDSRADPGLPVRPAGASPAAVAGARAGVGVALPEAYDAERIRAVLRGSTGSSDRGARGSAAARAERDGQGTATAEQRIPEGPASWSAATSWDETTRWDVNQGAQTAASWGTDASADTVAGWAANTGTGWDGFRSQPSPLWDAAAETLPDGGPRWDSGAGSLDLGGASANGNYYVSEPGDGSSDTAVFETPDLAQAEAIRRDPFSTAWLQDSELTSPPDVEPRWQDPGGAEPSPTDEESWFTPRERADEGLVPPERLARPPERLARPAESTAPVMGFWTPSAAARAPAPALAPAPAPAEVSDAPGAADRTASVQAQGPAPAPSPTIAGPAVPPAMPPGPVVPPSKSRSDRLYPVRLLVVIVVAALIGSILVLLLR